MTAQDATISGSISVDDGIVGLWHVIESGSGGALQSAQLAASSSLILDPATPEMLFKSGSTTLDTKLRLKPASEWSSTTGGNLSISGIDYTMASLSASGSLPTSSGSNASGTFGPYINETNTTSTYTVDQDGTYEVQARQVHTVTLSEPAAISAGTTAYPNYNPSFAGQQHPWSNNSSPISFYLYTYFVADGITGDNAGTQTRVLLKTVYHKGDYTSSPYYVAMDIGGGTLAWDYNSGTTTNASTTNYSGNAAELSKSIYLKAGTYKFRYETRVGVYSGYNRTTDSSGNQTFNYTADQFAYSAYSGISAQANATIVIPSNVVELTSKGLQLLTDSNTYVQVSRLDTGFATQPTLLKVKGGKIEIDGVEGNSADLTANFGDFQSASFDNIREVGSPFATNQGYGTNSSYFFPATDNSDDLGTSGRRWKNVYASNGTIQTSDENQKENISGSDLGLEFINNLNPIKYNFITGSRTHYGLTAQQVSESLASSSVHTDNFAGYIKNVIYQSGSAIGDKREIEAQGWNINNFTVVDTHLGLRYNEMIAPMIKAIQELSTKVTELENQISGSE